MTAPYKRNPCTSSENRLSKVTLLAMLSDGSKIKTWFEGLNDDQWVITSFNHQTRQVCVEVTSTGSDQIHTVTVIIPPLV